MQANPDAAPMRRPAAPTLHPLTGIPLEIENSVAIATAVAQLPHNYNFEIKKSIWKIRAAGATRVALQFPEGLLLFSCIIADILEQFTGAECVIMGDVTFGACCVDDLGAAALGCDFMVHYGHSCLVPIDQTTSSVRMLYVFVDIDFDASHLIACIRANFPATGRVALLGTIQFAPTLHAVRTALAAYSALTIPQIKPLSPGEVLGCTSPRLPPGSVDAIVFVADGRFHLESAMIHNPSVPAFRYDPYGKVMTRETYDTEAMHGMRRAAIRRAQASMPPPPPAEPPEGAFAAAPCACAVAGASERGRDQSPPPSEPHSSESAALTRAAVAAASASAASSSSAVWGLVLGTLGRQGNRALLSRLEARLAAARVPYFVLLLSEVSPAKLAAFGPRVSAWVQVACPRLSIDWGDAFPAPTLTPYEAEVALGGVWREVYPMDYYARGSGPWTNLFDPAADARAAARAAKTAAAKLAADGAAAAGAAAPSPSS